MNISWNGEMARLRYANRRLERACPDSACMLDAFAVVEYGLRQSLAQRGESPACGVGCDHCCRQPIPATPLELFVLEAFARHVLSPEQRRAQQAAFAAFHGGREALAAPCPFLSAGRCVVYPVRPIACRQFVAFGRACLPGEDPTTTRSQDMLRPQYDFMHAALRRTLPWYRERCSLPERMTAAEAQAFFRRVTTLVQAVPWGDWFREC